MIIAYITQNPGCGFAELYRKFPDTALSSLRQRLYRMADRKEIIIRKGSKNRSTYYPAVGVQPEAHTLHIREIVSVFCYA